MTSSSASGQIFVKGENMLTLQGDVNIYAYTLKYSDPKKEGTVDESNSSKIYISKGLIATNLNQITPLLFRIAN